MKKIQLLFLLFFTIIIAQGCCLFEKGGWQPLPCLNSDKKEDIGEKEKESEPSKDEKDTLKVK